MNWKLAIGYGLLIWILMFVIVSVFIAFNIYQLAAVMWLTPVISGIIAYILAGRLKPTSLGVALGYGLTWLVIGGILDALITMRFNAAIFSSWSLWLGYALMILAVVLRVKKA